ncbi:MAG: hypothetical protein ACRYG8_45705 [Janthinobacterium lividum]
MIKRRTLLAATAAALATPAIAQQKLLMRFVPEGDVAVLDPIWTTATVTRNHGYLVFDTLYGQTADYTIEPQMVAGHTTENDGKLWRGSYWVSGWWWVRHPTRPATRAPSRALPRRRALEEAEVKR